MRKQISIILILLCSLSFAQSSQELLNQAKTDWANGNCMDASVKLELVNSHLSDFPEKFQSEISNLNKEWNSLIDKDETIINSIREYIPPLRNDEGNALSVNEIQSARTTLLELIDKTNDIKCNDIKVPIVRKLHALQDSTNILIDEFIDYIIVENNDLSVAVDSLRLLAGKYRTLSPILDSLRSLVAQNASDLEHLQNELDEIVHIASQGAAFTDDGNENKSEVLSPVMMVSDAIVDMVEAKLINIGETKIKGKTLSDIEKDDLIIELDNIIAWLDSSAAAQNTTLKTSALKEMANNYKGYMTEKKVAIKEDLNRWLIGGVTFLVLIVVIVVLITGRKKKN